MPAICRRETAGSGLKVELMPGRHGAAQGHWLRKIYEIGPTLLL
jgi:hypothetical protein